MQYNRNGIENIEKRNITKRNKKSYKIILGYIASIILLLFTIKGALGLNLTQDNIIYFAADNTSLNLSIIGTVDTSTGKIGTGIDFPDANDAMQGPVYDDTSGVITIAYWMKGFTTGSTVVSAIDSGFTDGWSTFNLYAGNKIGFYNSEGSTCYEGSVSWGVGAWHHVIIQYNTSSDAKGWYDNSLMSEIKDDCNGHGNLDSSNPLELGAVTGYGSDYDGELDDVRIWTRELTSAERAAIYNSGNGNETYSTGDEWFWSNMNMPEDSSPNDDHATLRNSNGTSIDGILGSTFTFDGTDDYITISPDMNGATDYTMNAWIKTPNDASSGRIFHFQDGSDQTRWFVDINADGEIESYLKAGGVAWVCSDATSTKVLDNDTWVMITMVVNDGKNCSTYINGQYETSVSHDGTNANWATTTWRIGSHITGSAYWTGEIDEFGLWNRSLNDANISELYNSGSGKNPYITEATPLAASNTSNAVFEYPSPPDNAHNDTQQTWNISCADGKVTMWFNGSIVINNQTSPANYTSSVSTVTDYSIIANCYNDTNGWAINQTRTWYYDNIDPVWTIRSINTDNSTVFEGNQPGYIYFNDTLSDHYVFSYNITTYYPNGTVWWSNQTTGLAGTEYNFTRNETTIGIPAGTYTINYYGEDDHTAKSIPDYSYWESIDGLEYWTPTGSYIQIKNLFTTNGDATTIKQGDRYTFGFDTSGSKGKWSFELISNEKLWYRGDLYPFPAFVTGKHWVDFNIQGIPQEHIKYTVQYKNDYLYEIEIEIEEEYGPGLTFNSLGGLNIVNNTYTFQIDLYPTPSYQGQTPANNTFSNDNDTINITGCGGMNNMIIYDNTTPPNTIWQNSATNSTYNIPRNEGIYYFMAACYNTTTSLYGNFSPIRLFEFNLTNVTINITDDDNIMLPSTSTYDNETTETITGNLYYNELGDYIRLRTEIDQVQFNVTDLIGKHTNEVVNKQISRTNYTHTIQMTDRVRMGLYFTNLTDVIILQINNVTTTWTNTTYIQLNTSKMAAGDTFIIWNEKDGYSQKWYFDNNYSNTYFNKTFFVIDNYTYYYTVSKVTVKNNLNTQMGDASVDIEVPYNNTYITIGGDKTLADGSAIFTYQPGTSYKVTVTKTGYEDNEGIYSFGADTNRKVIVITGIGTDLGSYYCERPDQELTVSPVTRTIYCHFTAYDIYAELKSEFSDATTTTSNLTTSSSSTTLTHTMNINNLNSPVNVTLSIAGSEIEYWYFYYPYPRPNVTTNNNGTITMSEDQMTLSTQNRIIATIIVLIIVLFLIALGESKMPGLGLLVSSIFMIFIGGAYFAVLWHFTLIGAVILLLLGARKIAKMM